MAQQAQTFLDENTRDRARDKALVCMRVTNTRVSHLALPGGNLIGLGEFECWVYEDEVPTVLALVEREPASIDTAKRANDVSIANDVRKAAEFHGTADDVVKLIADKSNERINQVYKHIMDTTPKNWQAKFFELYGRSVNPLDAAEVVDGVKPRIEPQLAREIRRAKLISDATRNAK